MVSATKAMSSDDQPPPEPAPLVDARYVTSRTANALNILLSDLTEASKAIKDQGTDADTLDAAAEAVTETANEAKDLLRMLRKGMEAKLQSSQTLKNRVVTGLEAASSSIDSSATATVEALDKMEKATSAAVERCEQIGDVQIDLTNLVNGDTPHQQAYMGKIQAITEDMTTYYQQASNDRQYFVNPIDRHPNKQLTQSRLQHVVDESFRRLIQPALSKLNSEAIHTVESRHQELIQLHAEAERLKTQNGQLYHQLSIATGTTGGSLVETDNAQMTQVQTSNQELRAAYSTLLQTHATLQAEYENAMKEGRRIFSELESVKREFQQLQTKSQDYEQSSGQQVLNLANQLRQEQEKTRKLRYDNEDLIYNQNKYRYRERAHRVESNIELPDITWSIVAGGSPQKRVNRVVVEADVLQSLIAQAADTQNRTGSNQSNDGITATGQIDFDNELEQLVHQYRDRAHIPAGVWQSLVPYNTHTSGTRYTAGAAQSHMEASGASVLGRPELENQLAPQPNPSTLRTFGGPPQHSGVSIFNRTGFPVTETRPQPGAYDGSASKTEGSPAPRYVRFDETPKPTTMASSCRLTIQSGRPSASISPFGSS
ncbi:hypothetical protein BDZ85DRAFT_304327 [Elsinoe ampelina]|uniref:Uncharacterized protein n=1 Tax=Elsinoe ampelina TaxID=302913 RepID=A0A6A6G257_9PEZI|nr:hypothetical protein BDZ85DRAFT_304327 [Elsinoe ampelina]